VTVLDEDAIPLTRALATSIEMPDRVELEELSVPGALLDYYFGHGERTVMLQADAILTLGTVETSLDGTQRHWEVSLEPSTFPTQQAALTERSALRRG
jgi:hypothetical protein